MASPKLTDHARDPPQALASATPRFESWLRAAAQLSFSPAPLRLPALPVGAELRGGRLLVRGTLGRGGMGTVHEVYDREYGATLALKELPFSSPELLLAFKREFRALQGIHHPNLVQLGELFEEAGRWFFTMERVDGVPFTQFVRLRQRLQVGRLKASLIALSGGLLALHRAGKIHRDVKPSNVLIEPSGRVVLLDFGLIAEIGCSSSSEFSRAGTVAYMAPEQATGVFGPAADWYAVGIMLYEALTGKLPFVGGREAVLAQKANGLTTPLLAHAADAPPELESLCRELLETNPLLRANGGNVHSRLSSMPEPSPGPGTSKRPFVGREPELARLRQAFEASRRQGPLAVVIRGESGVGKSALLARLAEVLGPEAQIFSGRCYEHEFVPFKALDGAMDALARHLAQLPRRELRALLPEDMNALSRVFPPLDFACRRTRRAEVGLESSPREVRQRAFSALRELLSRLATRGPLALAIDDMQWADQDSLSALEELFTCASPPPLSLILSVRGEAVLPNFGGACQQLELSALSTGDATELAARLLASECDGLVSDARRLSEEARCNPFLIEVLVHRARANQAAFASLEQALTERLTTLEADARDVVDLVSLSPHPLPVPVLARASRLEPARLQRLVRALCASREIVTVRGEPHNALQLYHESLRQAACLAMTQERHEYCHTRLAAARAALAHEPSGALAP